MKQDSLEGLYEELNGLKSMADKEECLNSAIRDAIRAKNFAFATQICDFIVNDEIGKFGVFLRIKALMWLTDYIAKKIWKRRNIRILSASWTAYGNLDG